MIKNIFGLIFLLFVISSCETYNVDSTNDVYFQRRGDIFQHKRQEQEKERMEQKKARIEILHKENRNIKPIDARTLKKISGYGS